VLDVKPTRVDDTGSDEDNVHLDIIEAETEVIVKAVDSMLTDGIATTQPRQKSSMCLARRCLMNSVLGINKNPLSTQKSPPCKMPRKERFIDETHFVTMLERDERKDIVFSKEIRDRARKEGKERMSDKAIKKDVIKLYSLSAFKPRKFVNGKLMQASRFKHMKLSSAVVGDSTNGSQQDRNNCIGILQRDHLAYYANLRHKSHIKIADTFSKMKLATSLALYSSAPAFRPCHRWKKST